MIVLKLRIGTTESGGQDVLQIHKNNIYICIYNLVLYISELGWMSYNNIG